MDYGHPEARQTALAAHYISRLHIMYIYTYMYIYW